MLVKSHCWLVKSLDNNDCDDDKLILWLVWPTKVYQAWTYIMPTARSSIYRRHHRDQGLNFHRAFMSDFLGKVCVAAISTSPLCHLCYLCCFYCAGNVFCQICFAYYFFFNFEYRSTQDSSMKIASFRFFSGFTKPYKVVLYSVKVKQSFSFNWRKGVMFSLTFDPLNILCLESSIFFKLKVSYKHWSWGMLFQMVFLEILQGSG